MSGHTPTENPAKRHWFIGDSVIVRYDGDRVGVRIRAGFDGDRRYYRCYGVDINGNDGGYIEYPTLIESLQQGEAWLP